MATPADESYNASRLDALKLKAGLIYHASPGTPVSTANATSDATATALADALITALATHQADACNATTGAGAHIAASTPATAPTATLGTKISYLRDAVNAHLADAAVHASPDRANQVTLAGIQINGSAASAWAQLNAIKSALNAHMAAAMTAEVAEPAA